MSYNRMNRKLTHMHEIEETGDRLKELGLRPDTTVHAYDLLIPDGKYFASHPEYFSLVGGRRIRHSEGGQLCLSSHAMRAAFAEELCVRIAADRETAVFGFCPNDGYGHCECVDCRALDSTADAATKGVNRRVADFVQDICARVALMEPDALLGHYSYSNFNRFLDYVEEPPPNLLVSCTMFHCHSHSVFDGECPVNPKQAARLKDVRSKVRHVYVYDYFSHNWGSLPAPYWHAIIEDFREYRRLGVDGWMSECGAADAEMWAAHWSVYYMAAKMLWDCSGDLPGFIRELCADRYGSGSRAAAQMERFYHALQDAVSDHGFCLDRPPESFKKFFSPQVQAECAAAIGSAGDSGLVMRERAVFELQRENYREREKYVSSTAITAGRLDGAPQPLHLVERSSQLPCKECDTKVWVSADASQIHFRMQMDETHMDKLLVNSGSPCNGDNIELFLDDGKNPAICYHYIIAPDGSISASECEGTRWNFSWRHNTKVVAHSLPGRWELSISIPRADINAMEDSFGFSVIRNRYPCGWRIYGVPSGGAYFATEKCIRCIIPENDGI